MNWEAAALKNGSRAETKEFTMITLQYYKYKEFETIFRNSITFNGVCEGNCNSSE